MTNGSFTIQSILLLQNVLLVQALVQLSIIYDNRCFSAELIELFEILMMCVVKRDIFEPGL